VQSTTVCIHPGTSLISTAPPYWLTVRNLSCSTSHPWRWTGPWIWYTEANHLHSLNLHEVFKVRDSIIKLESHQAAGAASLKQWTS